jgi:hypothetical protein
LSRAQSAPGSDARLPLTEHEHSAPASLLRAQTYPGLAASSPVTGQGQAAPAAARTFKEPKLAAIITRQVRIRLFFIHPNCTLSGTGLHVSYFEYMGINKK